MEIIKHWSEFLQDKLSPKNMQKLQRIVAKYDSESEINTESYTDLYVTLFSFWFDDKCLTYQELNDLTFESLQKILPWKIQLLILDATLHFMSVKHEIASGLNFLSNCFIPALNLPLIKEARPQYHDLPLDCQLDKQVLSMTFYNILLKAVHMSQPDLYLEDMDVTSLNKDKLESYKNCATAGLQVLVCILTKVNGILQGCKECRELIDGYIYAIKRTAAYLYMLCISHTGVHLWTNNGSNVNAKALLTQLCCACRVSNLHVLLTGEEKPLSNATLPLLPNGLLPEIFKIYPSKFTVEKWRHFPALKHVLVYTITQVQYPFLSKQIKSIIPALLLITDDYTLENKVLGISSLDYVITNLNPSDLNLYNHGNVIYDCLFKHMYCADNEVLEVLLPCLRKILLVLEPKSDKIETLKYRKVDVTFQQILSRLEMENKLVQRRTLLRNIKEFVQIMGVTITRHMRRLLLVLSDCLKYYDGEEEEARICSLLILKCIICQQGPVLVHHSMDIVKSVLTLMVEVHNSDCMSDKHLIARNVLVDQCCDIIRKIKDYGCEINDQLRCVSEADLCNNCQPVKKLIRSILVE